MAAAAETFPQHPQRWTLDEVLALPEDQGQRVELVDGTVVVSPAPGGGHQRVLHRLQVSVDRAVPTEYELLPGVNVVLNGERLLIPDLVITMVPGANTLYFDAADILLAVEVLSPSSRVYDRALKRQLYAEAAIPFFVIVDPVAEPVSAIAYEFDGAGYRETVRSDNGVLKWERPFPVLVDLAR
ncbi:Uma2 family endonuclease [Allokutzneria sp. NRRL B-24872]|uniref:Uma2 family endonuclease n=1 Tax=Allokutzneria sp. NRRL B-24872 TaxID=1137961 RepID=UPI000A3A4FA5|nr:Uma2 family endonuclease [Allokutzneria sp. NRRL B-24872]